jgi:flagella basal body P-ring formation protein FlgA
MRALLILAAATLVAAGPALAGQLVSLKVDTVDTDGMVTLGDLFDGAGAAAGVRLAARPSANLVLDAAAVQAAARRAGLDWPNAEGLRKIVVRGPAAAAPAGPVAARGNVDVLTYARSLSTGEVIQPADLVWAKAAGAPADAPSDPDAVIGMAAKRPLRVGATVSARDVGVSQVIKPGDMIQVTYDADGVTLSLQGKALSAGGVGETISVQNPNSHKTVQAVVSGPGSAVVGPAAQDMKSSRSSLRYAAR